MSAKKSFLILSAIMLISSICGTAEAIDGDLDCDGDVDFIDFSIMAGDWRKTDPIRIGSDGNLMGGASWVWDAGQGGGPSWHYKDPNQCVQLDGVDGWVNLDDSDFSNFHNKTIAFWVKIREYPEVDRYMFYFNADNPCNDNPYPIYFMTHGSPYVRVCFLDVCSLDSVTALVWHHLAFVLQDTWGGLCNGTFYRDGVAQFTWPAEPRHSGAAVGVNLGSENDGSGNDVNAIFDDFRVYDYALSAAEVSSLFYATAGAGGSGYTAPDANMLLHYTFDETSGTTAANSSTYEFYHPLLSRAELYTGEPQGDRVINFMDFAILADNWLE